jgi:hypothetical protein
MYTAMLPNSDGMFTVDVIEHEGEFWLVPGWLDNKVEGWSKPVRIIRLNSVPHQKTLGGKYSDFLVASNAIPKAVLDGHVQFGSSGLIEVVESPDIRVVIPTRH